MLLRHGSLSRRDAFLLLFGALVMHIWSILSSQQQSQAILIDAPPEVEHDHTIFRTQTRIQIHTVTQTTTAAVAVESAIVAYGDLPGTSVLAHAPGWTIFQDLYMSNGTLYLVADESRRSKFPELRKIVSHPIISLNTPENIAAREPSDVDMAFITPEEAQRRWGSRIFSVEGNTILVNEPKQFLRHYYHFVAELFFGIQAFWHGFFSESTPNSDHPDFSIVHPSPPPIHRIIFGYANADGWRDGPGFDSYFLRATLPSISVEHEEDWNDRISITRSNTRAWRFPLLFLADPSAAHRGSTCGSTHRKAAEAWEYMRVKGKLRGLYVGGWWAPLREAMWKFAGADAEFHDLEHAPPSPVLLEPLESNVDPGTVANVGPEAQSSLPMPERIVLTYIDRQGAHNRNLIDSDNLGLIEAIQELVDRKNKERRVFLKQLEEDNFQAFAEKRARRLPLEWEFIVMQAGKLTKEEQVRVAARTTIMFGLHGNGLTHLVWMPPNRLSAVIEIFCPLGFAQDYHWTARALGMTHYAVWNDTYITHPEKPKVDYPKCFQGKEIPVHGPTVAQLIEDRVSSHS